MLQKRFILSCVLGFIAYHIVYAQSIQYEHITLKTEQFSLPNRKFYIQRIICDFNQPKYFLIRKGLISHQKQMTLGDSIQKVLMKYLKPSNTYKAGLVPVMIKVKELKIREERHFLKEEGMAKIAMEFYVETDSKPDKIFQSNAFRTYSGFINVTPQHDENIREVIKSCMMDFNNAKIDFSKYVIPNKVFKAKRNL
jgi:hypothetical protein